MKQERTVYIEDWRAAVTGNPGPISVCTAVVVIILAILFTYSYIIVGNLLQMTIFEQIYIRERESPIYVNPDQHTTMQHCNSTKIFSHGPVDTAQ